MGNLLFFSGSIDEIAGGGVATELISSRRLRAKRADGRLARQLLEYFLEDGGQFRYPQAEDTPVDLAAMFSSGTL